MAKLTVKYESKGHKIYEAPSKYTDKDVIAIAYESRNHGTLHRLYTLGSVARYAMDYCECPVSAIKIAKERGQALHYAIPKSTILTKKKTYSLSLFEGSVVSLQLKCNKKNVVATKEAKIIRNVFIYFVFTIIR